MSMKKKEIRVCDFCGKEVGDNFVYVSDVPNEGCSELYFQEGRKTAKSYCFDNTDFCDINCFFKEMKKKLEIL